MALYEPTVIGDSIKQLFIDYTTLPSTLKIDFPCMFVLLDGAIISAVFKNSFTANDGTKQSLLNTSYTPTVTSFDLVVNGCVVSRRRYGNPGVSQSVAYEDARNLLKGLLSAVKSALGGGSLVDEDDGGLKLTSINVFPNNGSTDTIKNLKKKSSV